MKDDICKAYIHTYKCDKKTCDKCQYKYSDANANHTVDILKNLVPKCCKMVDGKLKGGFVDWDTVEGKAVNEALLAMEKLDKIKEIVVERDNPFFGEAYYMLDNLVKKIKEIIEN